MQAMLQELVASHAATSNSIHKELQALATQLPKPHEPQQSSPVPLQSSSGRADRRSRWLGEEEPSEDPMVVAEETTSRISYIDRLAATPRARLSRAGRHVAAPTSFSRTASSFKRRERMSECTGGSESPSLRRTSEAAPPSSRRSSEGDTAQAGAPTSPGSAAAAKSWAGFNGRAIVAGGDDVARASPVVRLPSSTEDSASPSAAPPGAPPLARPPSTTTTTPADSARSEVMRPLAGTPSERSDSPADRSKRYSKSLLKSAASVRTVLKGTNSLLAGLAMSQEERRRGSLSAPRRLRSGLPTPSCEPSPTPHTRPRGLSDVHEEADDAEEQSRQDFGNEQRLRALLTQDGDVETIISRMRRAETDTNMAELQQTDWAARHPVSAKLVMRPGSRTAQIWDLVTLAFVCASAFLTPLDIAFEISNAGATSVLIFVFDAVFILDFALGFRTGFYSATFIVRAAPARGPACATGPTPPPRAAHR